VTAVAGIYYYIIVDKNIMEANRTQGTAGNLRMSKSKDASNTE
jgi:hypothetical protein